MEMVAEGNEKRGGRGTRLWGVVFVGLGLIIIGLVIGIIVRGANKDSSDQTDWRQELNTALESVDKNDIKSIIETYDRYLEHFEGEELAEIYTERALKIFGKDLEKKYGKRVISDLIAADDILKTENSAIMIINSAGNYGDEETRDKYIEILNERTGDETMESMG